MATKKVTRSKSQGKTAVRAKRGGADKLGPPLVPKGEAEDLVAGLSQVLENLLDLAEVAQEDPYDAIALESILRVRQMRGVVQVYLRHHAGVGAGGAS